MMGGGAPQAGGMNPAMMQMMMMMMMNNKSGKEGNKKDKNKECYHRFFRDFFSLWYAFILSLRAFRPKPFHF